MPPRFERGRSEPRKHPWVQIKPLQSVFVQLLVPANEIQGSPTHYVPGVGTVLCGRTDCAYCHLPEKYTWFASCNQWLDPQGPFALDAKFGQLKGEWVKRVLRITSHMEDLTLDDHHNEIIKVWREGNYKNAPLHWETAEVIPEARRLPLSPHPWEPLVMACMAPRSSKKKKPTTPPPGPVTRGEVNVEVPDENKPGKYSTFDFGRLDPAHLPPTFPSVQLLMKALSGDAGTVAFERAEQFMRSFGGNGNGKRIVSDSANQKVREIISIVADKARPPE